MMYTMKVMLTSFHVTHVCSSRGQINQLKWIRCHCLLCRRQWLHAYVQYIILCLYQCIALNEWAMILCMVNVYAAHVSSHPQRVMWWVQATGQEINSPSRTMIPVPLTGQLSIQVNNHHQQSQCRWMSLSSTACSFTSPVFFLSSSLLSEYAASVTVREERHA